MSVLWDKDWRFKISLDKDLRQDVTDFAKRVNGKEARSTMLQEINLYKKYFSLEEVISHLSTMNEKDIKSFVANIKRNIQNLIHIPNELVEHYKSIIAKEPKSRQELLYFLLDYASKNKTFFPLKTYYKLVLGKFYSKVVAKCKKYASLNKTNVKAKMLQEYEVLNSINNLETKIKSSPSTLNLWGKGNEIEYSLKYNNSFGFGKFRNGKTSGLSNVLTVNCPTHRVDENDLHMQYLTNVYPGYAHFVNIEFEDTTQRNIDFGANFIFNGWSTFSAWHIFPSAYTKNLKIINSKIVALLLKNPSEKLYTQIYRLLLNTFDHFVATKIFIQITQKPAKYESRILGAIATEIVIDKGYAINPNNYLKRLQQVDITNYFTNLEKIK